MNTTNMTTTTDKKVTAIHEVATRFNELAQQEKWFEIQDELFAENVKSIDPPNSPYFGDAEGKSAVRKKGEDFVKRITEVHRLSTTEPIVTGNHFAVGREKDLTVEGHGRIQINEIMLYEVRNGEIVLEQFFY
jgi:ketosteroid isomerase-like protein